MSDVDEAVEGLLSERGETGYRRVGSWIRREIMEGRISPGEWLRLQYIADRCGVSIQPVREAMQLLEGEGLVQIFPNRGAQVRGINRERVEHIYDIREAIESMLVAKFCVLATATDIRKLRELQAVHDEASGRRDGPATSRANYAFHRYINAKSGNSEALALVDRYQELAFSLHNYFPTAAAEDRSERVCMEHNMMIDAFEMRDPEGAAAMSKMHVRGTRRDILDRIDRGAHMPASPVASGR